MKNLELTTRIMKAFVKVFTHIETLVEEVDKTQSIGAAMLSSGSAISTDASVGFFLTQYRHGIDAQLKLAEYPIEWARAVRTIIALRKNGYR